MLSIENKKDIFTKYIELGSFGLPIEEFVEIVFLNFYEEINNELASVEQIPTTEVWETLNKAVTEFDLDHPILKILDNHPFFRQIIGPEYSMFNRYPKVYDYLFNQWDITHLDEINIGIIGAGYGQEIITTLFYVEQMLQRTNKTGKNYHVTVLSQNNRIFQKLRHGMLYPKTTINHYFKNSMNVYFEEQKEDVFSFSRNFTQKVTFQDFDLLHVDKSPIQDAAFDLLLIHNVIQYLTLNIEVQTLKAKLVKIFRYMDLVTKPEAIISIINEVSKPNTHISEVCDSFAGNLSSYHKHQWGKATIYIKKGY